MDLPKWIPPSVQGACEFCLSSALATEGVGGACVFLSSQLTESGAWDTVTINS